MTSNYFLRYLKFQTDVQSFLQGAFYQTSAQFSETRKYKKNDDLSFKSFNYLNHSLLSKCGPSPSWLLLISQVTWVSLTQVSCFAADVVVGSMKVVLGNRFSACPWLAEMSGYKMQNANWMSVSKVCRTLIFSIACFFSYLYYFPD